jgi:hypothetical protein
VAPSKKGQTPTRQGVAASVAKMLAFSVVDSLTAFDAAEWIMRLVDQETRWDGQDHRY